MDGQGCGRGAAERWSWAQDSGLWKGEQAQGRLVRLRAAGGSRNRQARGAGEQAEDEASTGWVGGGETQLPSRQHRAEM